LFTLGKAICIVFEYHTDTWKETLFAFFMTIFVNSQMVNPDFIP